MFSKAKVLIPMGSGDITKGCVPDTSKYGIKMEQDGSLYLSCNCEKIPIYSLA